MLHTLEYTKKYNTLLKKYETVSNILNQNTTDDITTIANYINEIEKNMENQKMLH